MAASLSRRLAAWVAGLRFEDLPPEVVDRARGVTLHGVASALVGHDGSGPQQALRLMQEEEAGGAGVGTVLVHGTKLTRGGAAFVNAEMILAGGKWDTFRMLTHPGSAILPAALVAAEVEHATGRDYLVAIAAGYEVMERLAGDFIPSVMARGFHSGPIFGIFGAAVAAAKLMRLSEDQINTAIAQCVNLAAGNLEGARSGRGTLREAGAVRNALLAVALARHGTPGSETALEGDAGFYHAYTGNNVGKLTYSFDGQLSTSLDKVTEGLGRDWMFLETLYRIYSTAGYNIAHIDVTAKLCEEHDIKPEDVARVDAVVNWLETQYPSPAFPAPGPRSAALHGAGPRSAALHGAGRMGGPTVGSTHYFSAYGVVMRGFPILKAVTPGGPSDDPPEVLDLMQRVTLIPSHSQTLFGPSVTIQLKDGRSFTKHATGREFIWNFDEEARRIRGVVPGIPIPADQFEDLITACRDLDRLDRADQVIGFTLPRP